MELFVFFIWAIFWSFWSALVNRLMKKDYKGFVFWRSKCVYCNNYLSWIDLIPILSYIILKGKCRYCWRRISFLYFLLEIITWLFFVLSYKTTDNLFEFFFIIFIWYLLILLAFWDLWFYLLVDDLYKVLVVFTLIISLYFNNWINSLIFWILLFLLFYLIYFFSFYYIKFRYWYKAEGFWLWDVLLALPIGVILWIKYHIYYILIYVILSSFVWIIIYLLIYLSWNKWKSLPFVPAMVLSFFLMRFLYWFFNKIFY